MTRSSRGRPTNIALHILGAELAARHLKAFTRSEPSIAATLRMPTFESGERLSWPPLLGAASFPPVVLTGDPRLYTGEWWTEKSVRCGPSSVRPAAASRARLSRSTAR